MPSNSLFINDSDAGHVAVDIAGSTSLDDDSSDDQTSREYYRSSSNSSGRGAFLRLSQSITARTGGNVGNVGDHSKQQQQEQKQQSNGRPQLKETFSFDKLYRPSESLPSALDSSNGREESTHVSSAGTGDEPYSEMVARVCLVSKPVWEQYLGLSAAAAPQRARNRNHGMSRYMDPVGCHSLRKMQAEEGESNPPKSSSPRLSTVSEHGERKNWPSGTSGDAPRTPKSLCCLPMLSPSCRVAVAWSIFMVLVDATYVAFIMPLNAGFCPLLPGKLTWCSAIDLAAGVVFLVNLIMAFHTGIVISFDLKKHRLMAGKVVARYYVFRGSFWVDAISVLPLIFQVIVLGVGFHDYWVNRAISFLQLIRLLRLVHLLRVLYVDSVINSSHTTLGGLIPMTGMLALVMLYSGAVLLNFLTCLTWLVIDLEGIEHSLMAEPVGDIDMFHANTATRYLVGLYWVFTTVTGTGYGDLVPRTLAEMCLAMLFMLCGVTMLALLISSMAELLTAATATARKAHVFREKMQEVNEWMSKRNIPRKLQRQISSYYSQAWLHHSEHSEEAKVFKELPHFLRASVASHITRSMMSGDEASGTSIPALSGLQADAKEALSSRLQPVEELPGHELCREGDAADYLWLFQEGVMMAMRHGRPVEIIVAPCLLGESVLLAEEIPSCGVRPCTLRAVSACHLWQLSMRDLQPLFQLYPHMRAQLLDGVRTNMLARLDKHSDGGAAGNSSNSSDGSAAAMRRTLKSFGSMPPKGSPTAARAQQQWQQQRQHWQQHHKPFSELLMHLERLPSGLADGPMNKEELLRQLQEASADNGSLQRALQNLSHKSPTAEIPTASEQAASHQPQHSIVGNSNVTSDGITQQTPGSMPTPASHHGTQLPNSHSSAALTGGGIQTRSGTGSHNTHSSSSGNVGAAAAATAAAATADGASAAVHAVQWQLPSAPGHPAVAANASAAIELSHTADHGSA